MDMHWLDRAPSHGHYPVVTTRKHPKNQATSKTKPHLRAWEPKLGCFLIFLVSLRSESLHTADTSWCHSSHTANISYSPHSRNSVRGAWKAAVHGPRFLSSRVFKKKKLIQMWVKRMKKEKQKKSMASVLRANANQTKAWKPCSHLVAVFFSPVGSWKSFGMVWPWNLRLHHWWWRKKISPPKTWRTETDRNLRQELSWWMRNPAPGYMKTLSRKETGRNHQPTSTFSTPGIVISNTSTRRLVKKEEWHHIGHKNTICALHDFLRDQKWSHTRPSGRTKSSPTSMSS